MIGKSSTARSGRWDDLARRLVFAKLGAFSTGLIRIVEEGQAHEFGTADNTLEATVHVHDPHFYRAMALGGSLGAAEAYIDGRVTIEGGGILEFLSMIRANNPWESGRSIDAKNVLARGLGTVRQKTGKQNLPKYACVSIERCFRGALAPGPLPSPHPTFNTKVLLEVASSEVTRIAARSAF